MGKEIVISPLPGSYIKQAIGAVLILLAGFAAFSSFYIVESEEQAVVLRFGKFHTITDPGLHFKIPFGVDRAIKVATRRQHKEEFGYRTRSVQLGGPTR